MRQAFMLEPMVNISVLILVVMEYTQWVFLDFLSIFSLSLNPCCNGIYSMSAYSLSETKLNESLNPCCNGIYSMSLPIL